ncbi:CBS domain-containing protein [Streptomyces sp. CC219B]|uniref:CBS domain-containing protein n=1 Tax=Streptomyces sp. CC219B TaxID=3044574 RepID=UPI0024A8A7A6|nr:CBS domain-containing protein [Streptomyces sp. CC219B]
MDGTPSTVDDVMTRRVVAVRRAAAFKDIVKTMRRWHVSGVPVVDDDNRVVGVVSQADLLLKEEVHDAGPDRSSRPVRPEDVAKAAARTAADLMTAPAATAHPHDTLAAAARAMARHGVKRLPVVDEHGVLAGIVSRADLLNVFLRDDDSIAREVRDEVVAFLFPEAPDAVRVQVRDGVVRLTGRVPSTALVPVAARLTRAVEGVVGVDCELLGPRRRPVLDPDLADDGAGR